MRLLRMETAKKWDRADEEIAGVRMSCHAFLHFCTKWYRSVVCGTRS